MIFAHSRGDNIQQAPIELCIPRLGRRGCGHRWRRPTTTQGMILIFAKGPPWPEHVGETSIDGANCATPSRRGWGAERTHAVARGNPATTSTLCSEASKLVAIHHRSSATQTEREAREMPIPEGLKRGSLVNSGVECHTQALRVGPGTWHTSRALDLRTPPTSLVPSRRKPVGHGAVGGLIGPHSLADRLDTCVWFCAALTAVATPTHRATNPCMAACFERMPFRSSKAAAPSATTCERSRTDMRYAAVAGVQDTGVHETHRPR